jgi:hypothetical protein
MYNLGTRKVKQERTSKVALFERPQGQAEYGNLQPLASGDHLGASDEVVNFLATMVRSAPDCSRLDL